MPLMDGFEFTEQAIQILKGVANPPKIVAVTGNVEMSYIERCFECGFSQVASKPISSHQVSLLALEQNLQVDVKQSVQETLELSA